MMPTPLGRLRWLCYLALSISTLSRAFASIGSYNPNSGNDNSAMGDYSIVVGGYANAASGEYSLVAGGIPAREVLSIVPMTETRTICMDLKFHVGMCSTSLTVLI